MVIALVFAHDGTVDPIMMYFSLLLNVRVKFFPLDELGLYDLFDAFIPLGLVLVETLIDITHLVLHNLLVALVQNL